MTAASAQETVRALIDARRRGERTALIAHLLSESATLTIDAGAHTSTSRTPVPGPRGDRPGTADPRSTHFLTGCWSSTRSTARPASSSESHDRVVGVISIANAKRARITQIWVVAQPGQARALEPDLNRRMRASVTDRPRVPVIAVGANPAPRIPEGKDMAKIVVIGGTGLIGSKVVAKLTEHGHEAVAAAPNTGVNTSPAKASPRRSPARMSSSMSSNSPSFEESAVLDFFTTSTTNLIAAERLPESGTTSPSPSSARTGRRTSPTSRQGRPGEADPRIGRPLLARARHPVLRVPRQHRRHLDRRRHRPPPRRAHPADGRRGCRDRRRPHCRRQPAGGDVEIAGPEAFGLDEFIRRGLTFRGDPRTVVRDDDAPYYGARIEERTLLPVDGRPDRRDASGGVAPAEPAAQLTTL